MAEVCPPSNPGRPNLPLSSLLGSRLARASLRVRELEAELENHKDQVAHLRGEVVRHAGLLRQTEDRLGAIYASHGWQFLLRYYRLRNLLLPAGSRRRTAAAACVGAVKRLLKRGQAGATDPGNAAAPTPAGPVTNGSPDGGTRGDDDRYARWIELHEPGPAELERQRAVRFDRAPRFRIPVLVGAGALPFLPDTVQSVVDQTYAAWELAVVVGTPEDGDCFRRQVPGDPRISILTLPDPDPTSRANAALGVVGAGAYVAFLEAGDTLAPFALFEVVQALNRHPDADFLYSDEDWLGPDGAGRCDPHFKPDWSPDTLRSHNYVGQLFVLSRDLLERVGRLRPGRAGARNYDLILRAAEAARRIVHLPRVLYHRRQPGMPEAPEVATRALQDHLARIGLPGEVGPGLHPGTFRVSYRLTSRPLVSILIPNRDNPDLLAGCLESIGRSSYDRYEILIIENNSRQPETFALYEQLARRPGTRVVRWDRPFHFAALNNHGATHAAGEVLLFLNNDVQVMNPDWLERLLEHALRPEVGAVGAKLYFPDGTIQHAGIIVGRDHGPCHNLVFADGRSPGYGNRLAATQNVAAVTGACLMTRRAVFEEVGGFDQAFAVSFNDIDLCLKMRRNGYQIIWTPHAELYHFESVTRGYLEDVEDRVRDQNELAAFRAKWQDWLPPVDPYYSPNLTRGRPDCSVQL